MSAWWEELVHAVTGRVRRHEDLPDLRALSSRPVALERTHYLVNDRERLGQERRAYVLRREPDRRRGSANIAVFSNGRGVGYLPTDVAEEMRPFLDQIGGAAIVNGAGAKSGSIRLWVDLPTRSALDEFVRAEAARTTLAGEGTETSGGSESDRQRFARFSRLEV
jgi:multidrug efflux pump subunit AcrB